MLENLFQLVKEYGQSEVVENPGVPNEDNDAVMAEASHAVAGTLQNALANGQMQDVLNIFKSDDTGQVMNNPLSQNMQAGFMDSITSKLGINKNVASGLAETLIPVVISKLVQRTNSTAQADNGFDLNGLIGSLTGGGGNSGGLNIGGLANQFTGGNFNLSNILSQVTSGARQQQESGGLSDVIKGFFGNQ